MKFLIVGLGNVGPEYHETRHNIGFEILDRLMIREDLQYDLERHAFKALWKFRGKQIHLLKPTTFMNLSGKAVRYWQQKLNIDKKHTLVLVDDVALEFGKIRIRGKGSDGGHNGLRSIQELCGGNQFPRLRFGIGNDFPKGFQSEFVLGKWTDEEWGCLVDLIPSCHQAIEDFILSGLVPTMNKFN